MNLTFYKPMATDSGIEHMFDLSIKVLDNKNISQEVAERLHEQAARESHQPAVEGKPFSANVAYEFADGLVFRLFDGGLGKEHKVLEFLPADETPAIQKRVLSRIPRLLQGAGVEEDALKSLRENLNPPPTRDR